MLPNTYEVRYSIKGMSLRHPLDAALFLLLCKGMYHGILVGDESFMSNPLPRRVVPFYGDDLIAVQQPDGTIYVLFARLCENLGLGRESQVRRAQRHAVLGAGLITLTIQTDGGPQQAQCLKLSLLPLWLSGVQVTRVKLELQDKLGRYQQEAADVLWQAFKPQILIEDDQAAMAPAAHDEALAQLQQIAEMGRAITRMAEQQMELQRQQQALATRLDNAGRIVRGIQGEIADVQVRLGVLEDRLAPAEYISEAQAAEVSNQVKALAELLTSKEAAKNHYQGIFGELYRRFGVSSYKLIRLGQYESVLKFLDDWRKATSGENV
jgi:hypothetical protein